MGRSSRGRQVKAVEEEIPGRPERREDQFQSMLYRVQPFDWVTYALCAAVLLAAMLAASWIPAARAARLDPVVTLRSD